MQTQVEFLYDSQYDKGLHGALSVRTSDEYGITVDMSGRGETGKLEPGDARLIGEAFIRAAGIQEAKDRKDAPQ